MAGARREVESLGRQSLLRQLLLLHDNDGAGRDVVGRGRQHVAHRHPSPHFCHTLLLTPGLYYGLRDTESHRSRTRRSVTEITHG